MIRKATGRKRGAWTRAIAGLLTLALLCGLLPTIAHETASATTWADEYLDQVVEWGVMRGDTNGDLYPTRNITRAEFAAMINRAYGYTEVGSIPFTDVDINAWYYDDIAIAYNMGYLNGTSATTVSPDEALSREQAVVILARNMMLEDSTGEVLGFSDSHEFASWSRNKIQAAVEAGLINGYPDGTFRPDSSITREEVAVVLSRAIGTLVQEPGAHILGSVYGNVVVNSSGVTLRNTTIAGDLYLTGGIGLGDVLLENVNVLGKIVVSGAGESNKGDASVILRNVTANKMVMDSANNQFITLRTEGNTAIQSTSVRTSAYLDDATGEGKGLLYIELDGEDGTTLQLAGNIKEVLNITPDSHLVLAAGTAEKITIDEKAIDASMAIEMDATVKELNLDVGTSVSGDGDIKSLVVNAAGCTVSMLPDQITIRPGLTANIHGEVMNSSTAAESSADPRLTASYPTVKDIAPNSATAVFSSNKSGTIYWATTALADGSTSEADLISPPVYGGTILQSGTIDADASKTEYTAALTDLLSDGSYYLTTVMVDGRGLHSPVKVTAFTTPDDTVPGFTVTPTMSQVSTANAQVTVMPNKSCLMYYALLPKNGVAPTAADFKAASITGNLGYGSVDVTKNTTLPVNVNNVDLEELTDYVLYLWLTDYDSAKSSAVVSVPFKTADETPPTITYLSKTDTKEKSITMTFAMDEPGTFYWAVVKSGDPFLVPISGQQQDPELYDEAAIIQTTSGVGALQKGNVAVKAGNTDYTFTINGLTGETAYDLYYIAKDSAGNYSLDKKPLTGEYVPMVQVTSVTTLDTNPPTVEQEFTDYNGEAADNNPLPDTDIRLVFNENIQGVVTENGKREYEALLEWYQAKDTDNDSLKKYVTALRNHFTLYQVVNGRATEVEERTGSDSDSADWVIDYRYATVTQENGKMVVTFPTNTRNNYGTSALHLAAGTTYYFHIEGIADIAEPANLMGNKDLDTFHTVYAQVNLSEEDETLIDSDDVTERPDGATGDVRVDLAFGITPSSVSRVADTEMYDVILWSDTSVDFNVYRRINDAVEGENGATIGGDGKWEYLGDARITAVGGEDTGISLRGNVVTTSGQATFELLNGLVEDVTYEYAIEITSVNGISDYDTWSELITFKVAVVAGSAGNLRTLAGNVNGQWDTMTQRGTVSSIGVAYNATVASDRLIVTRQFTDRSTPEFLSTSPTFSAGSSMVQMNLALDRDGTIYYVIAPKDEYPPAIPGTTISSDNDNDPDDKRGTYIPQKGSDRGAYPGYAGDYAAGSMNVLSSPDYLSIVNPRFSSTSNIQSGSISAIGYVTNAVTVGDQRALLPDTEYYAYFVLQGNGQVFSTVQCYQFKTTAVETPVVTVQAAGSSSVTLQTDQNANIYYALVEYNHLPDFISAKFTSSNANIPNTLPPGVTAPETVLEAMVEQVPSTVDATANGKTWFDMYANDALKSRVRDYIRGDLQVDPAYNTVAYWTASEQVANTPVLSSATTPTNFDSLMTEGLEYIVLATARHVFADNNTIASYGFGAARSLYKADTVPPEYTGGPGVTYVMTELQVYDSPDANAKLVPFTDWQENPMNYYYSGTVTITFDKNIYFIDNTNTRYEVWTGEPTTTTEVATAKYIMDILGGNTAGVSISGRTSKTPSSSFTFSFTKVSTGRTITLFNGGSICNANSTKSTKQLTLMFDATLTMASYPGGYAPTPYPGFRVTWQ